MFNFVTIKEVKERIGDWCRALRKQERLSQQELADLLAVSRLTISKLENGDNVTLDTLLKVLNHFGEMQSLHAYITNRNETLRTESLY